VEITKKKWKSVLVISYVIFFIEIYTVTKGVLNSYLCKSSTICQGVMYDPFVLYLSDSHDTVLTVNSDYFVKCHLPVYHCNGEFMYFLFYGILNIIQMRYSFRR
jgi:hypothetical protein